MVAAPTVFIVDDDPQARRGVTALATSKGWQARAFANGEDFLDAYRPHQAACLVLDYHLPDRDGLVLQRLLHDRAPELPVVFISAYADVPVAVTAMRRGAVTLLEKPYRAEELTEAIDEAVSLSTQRQREREASADIEAKLTTLTRTERQVLEMLLEGAMNKTISQRLVMSQRTVERTRASLLDKLGVGSALEAVKVVAQHFVNRGAKPRQSA